MRKYVFSTAIACLAVSSVSSATWLREKWNQPAAGNLPSVLAVVNSGSPPNEVVEMAEPAFVSLGTNYVARLSGWLTVPETGDYTFYLASDDYGALFLSQDEQVAQAIQIAEVPGWTNAQEWTKYPPQKSSPVALQQGQIVALYAVMQQGAGGDNLAIGWAGPGIQGVALIIDGVTDILPVPAMARVPVPAMEGTDVPRDTLLAWIPGKYASTHDAYLGTVFEDVNNASRTDPKSVLVSQGQDANTYDPAVPLEFGQTYYWRIDEVNAPENPGIHKGDVWHFAVEPYSYLVKPARAAAYSAMNSGTGPEKTIDGSGLNDRDEHGIDPMDMWISMAGQDPVWIQYEFDRPVVFDQMWVWNANQEIELDYGLGALDVTIEYSLDGSTWTRLGGVPQFNQGTADPSYVHNTTVDLQRVYARDIRLTLTSNWGGMLTQYSLSEIRFFQVPLRAYKPQPASGDAGVALDAVLNWRPGREAARHQVFFGADPNAPVLAGTVTGHNFSTPSLGLQYGRTYYWKVNEVNDAATPTSWEGDVWSFTTRAYRVVEDFESYDDACHRIFFAWLDGFGYSGSSDCGVVASAGNGTGSTVGNANPPFSEKLITHSGGQSLPLVYDNSIGRFYSETSRAWSASQAWSGGGVKNLTVYLRGAAAAFAQVSPGAFVMNGTGTDIWFAADQFRFAYKSLKGDGTIIARVDGLSNTDVSARAGVMIRESLEPGSRHAFVCVTPAKGASFVRRVAIGGMADGTTTAVAAGLTAPCWVKLTRKGNAFSAQHSADGVTWADIPAVPSRPAVEIPMAADVIYIGLAVTSRNAALVCGAKFSNVSTAGGVSGDWQTADVGVAQVPGNALDTFYVAVQDSTGKLKVVSHPDRTLIATGSWEKCSIALSQLTSAGVNLDSVRQLVLGIGNRDSPVMGGTGTVYIDDIRLEP